MRGAVCQALLPLLIKPDRNEALAVNEIFLALVRFPQSEMKSRAGLADEILLLFF